MTLSRLRAVWSIEVGVCNEAGVSSLLAFVLCISVGSLCGLQSGSGEDVGAEGEPSHPRQDLVSSPDVEAIGSPVAQPGMDQLTDGPSPLDGLGLFGGHLGAPAGDLGFVPGTGFEGLTA